MHSLLLTIACFSNAVETTPDEAVDGDHAPNQREGGREQ